MVRILKMLKLKTTKALYQLKAQCKSRSKCLSFSGKRDSYCKIWWFVRQRKARAKGFGLHMVLWESFCLFYVTWKLFSVSHSILFSTISLLVVCKVKYWLIITRLGISAGIGQHSIRARFSMFLTYKEKIYCFQLTREVSQKTILWISEQFTLTKNCMGLLPNHVIWKHIADGLIFRR